MKAQRLFQVRKTPPHSRLRKRIEEINYERIVGKREGGGVGADRLDRETFLCFTLVPAKVLLRDLIQRGKKFHADDSVEGVVRSHQQRASFSRAKIDEGEVAEVNRCLVGIRRLLQNVEHFVKRRRLGGLIGGMELAQQS